MNISFEEWDKPEEIRVRITHLLSGNEIDASE
jgi:hypothetical protein